MKSLLILALSLVVASAGFAPGSADAKRIGGGSSAGMQRSMPVRPPAQPAPPVQPAQATPTPAVTPNPAPAAVTPRRSWMGPIAGLAAGLGIAALMSHFGLGAGMGSFVTLLLLALVGFVVLRFVMSRFARAPAGLAPGSMATANGLPFGNGTPAPGNTAWQQPLPPAAPMASIGSTAAAVLPAGFDAAGFERIAKLIFIRMQAANDSSDLNDLRTFTTPEMFASIKLDLQERGDATQRTDVVRVDAEVLDVASEAERQIVSVRFHGLVKEASDAATEPFDEVWHLVKPADGSREWAIAGIQPSAPALARAA
jgi:predicted lipid-binding transport protein (Tim44 family)